MITLTAIVLSFILGSALITVWNRAAIKRSSEAIAAAESHEKA
jgi:hypothetical protein